MLEKSLKLVSRVVPSDRLLVIFVEGEEARVGASLFSAARPDSELSLSRTIVHEIMANKKSVLISDAGSDARFQKQESIVLSAMTSAIAVPLFDEDRVLGILYADTTNPRVCYNQDQLRALATFGNIIASRLANYQLLLERQAKREMESELENAAAIQKSLLSPVQPELSGYGVCAFQEQSKSVGGDLYDVSRLKDGRIFFVVGDVSGKGMGAALLMSNILACFRVMYGEPDFQLSRAVERVSAQLYSYSAPGQFATLICGLLACETGQLTYVNAGHNPPMVMKSDGRLQRLESTGLMIGAFDSVAWEERSCELAAGDMVTVYSDGVTEAIDPSEQEFGEERLAMVLKSNREKPPEELIACLRDEIREFAAGTPPPDDVTLLVLKRLAG
jgi:serine phosphatase RsbU (regulator of sigma subunit)